MKKLLIFTMAAALLIGILPVARVSADTLAVTSPKAGDVWQLGQKYIINWSHMSEAYSGPYIGTATILLAPPRPACFDSEPACLMPEVQPFTIITSAPNNGSFTWTVPESLVSFYQGSQQITVSLNNGAALGRSEIFTVSSTSKPPASIRIDTSSSLSGTVGQQFTATFSASGGSGSYTWNVSAGSTPPGLRLTPTNPCPLNNAGSGCFPQQDTIWLNGTPTQAGNYQFQLTAKDQNNNAAGSNWFTATITAGSIVEPCPDSNGLVFKYSDGPIVYILENGMKRPYPSGLVFLSWNNSFGVIVIVSPDCQFPNGTLVRFADGKLVKGSGPTVYLISQGMLRAFPSANVFFRLGYTFNQVLAASDGDLSLHAVGSLIE